MALVPGRLMYDDAFEKNFMLFFIVRRIKVVANEIQEHFMSCMQTTQSEC